MVACNDVRDDIGSAMAGEDWSPNMMNGDKNRWTYLGFHVYGVW